MNKEKYRKKKKNILKRNFINKFVQKNAEGYGLDKGNKSR